MKKDFPNVMYFSFFICSPDFHSSVYKMIDEDYQSGTKSFQWNIIWESGPWLQRLHSSELGSPFKNLWYKVLPW